VIINGEINSCTHLINYSKLLSAVQHSHRAFCCLWPGFTRHCFSIQVGFFCQATGKEKWRGCHIIYISIISLA